MIRDGSQERLKMGKKEAEWRGRFLVCVQEVWNSTADLPQTLGNKEFGFYKRERFIIILPIHFSHHTGCFFAFTLQGDILIFIYKVIIG